MLDKFLSWMERRAEMKCRRKLGGIPVLMVLYQPEKPKPNVVFQCHPALEDDEYLMAEFAVIAEHIREVHSDISVVM